VLAQLVLANLVATHVASANQTLTISATISAFSFSDVTFSKCSFSTCSLSSGGEWSWYALRIPCGPPRGPLGGLECLRGWLMLLLTSYRWKAKGKRSAREASA